MKKVFAPLSTIIIAAFLVLAFWSGHSVFILENTDLYAENGLFENLQAILLAIACLVFLAPVALEKRSDKLILLFCSALCYGFLLRELDVQHLDVPEAVKLIGAGTGRNIKLAAIFILIFFYAAFHFSHYKNAVIDFLKSRHGTLIIIGGSLLFLGDSFENHDAIIHHVYFEEISELGGYGLILLASFAANFSLHS